jgi:NAD(P)H dehydrogenase (quinone)
MKIGISGASGQLGQSVLAEIARVGGGHQVIGISRSPDKVPAPAEGRAGDYDQPESLAEAYEGLDRLLIIPSADLRPGVRGGQLRVAIDAAYRAGVKHVILMSATGTRRAVEPALGEGYWTGEQHLIRTAPSWTILRMNYYAETMAQEVQMAAGTGVLAGLGDERVAYVSREDVAAAAAGVLLGEGHAGAVYNATGPAVLTGPDVAAIASEVLGKTITFAVISAEQLRDGLAQAGLPEPLIRTILDIKSTFGRGDFDVLTTDVERLSGRKAKTFGDALATELAQRPQA